MCNLQLQASLAYRVFRTRVETAVLLCSPGCTIWAKALVTPLSGKGLIHLLCYHELLLSNWDSFFNIWQLSWLAWKWALPCLQNFALSLDKSQTSHIWYQEARSPYQKVHLGKVRKTTVLMKLNFILQEKINSDALQNCVWYSFLCAFFFVCTLFIKKKRVKKGGMHTKEKSGDNMVQWSCWPSSKCHST